MIVGGAHMVRFAMCAKRIADIAKRRDICATLSLRNKNTSLGLRRGYLRFGSHDHRAVYAGRGSWQPKPAASGRGLRSPALAVAERNENTILVTANLLVKVLPRAGGYGPARDPRQIQDE